MSKRTSTAYKAHLLIVAKLRTTRQMSRGSAQIWPIIAVKVSSFHISPRYVKISIDTTVAVLEVDSLLRAEDKLTVPSIVRDSQQIGLERVETQSL